jgi:hypothetical protein
MRLISPDEVAEPILIMNSVSVLLPDAAQQSRRGG